MRDHMILPHTLKKKTQTKESEGDSTKETHMSRSPASQSLGRGAPTDATDQNASKALPPFNCSSIAVPYVAVNMQPMVPFHMTLRNGPFDAKKMWKAAVSGVRTLQLLRAGGTGTTAATATVTTSHTSKGGHPVENPVQQQPHDFVVVTGHSLGYLLCWSVDKQTLINSGQHFNNPTVSHVVVTTSFIYTCVEKQNSKGGQVGDDSEIYVWDASTLALIDKLSGHEDRVTSISVDDRKEHRLVSGGTDHLVFVWDISVHRAKPVTKLAGHNSTVTKVLITGSSVISAGGDGEIRLWDVQKGKCLHIFEGHQGQVTVLEWLARPTLGSHFRGTICSCCNGGLVRGWDYTPAGDDEDSVATMVQLFFNKAHKATVTDVACDKDIVVSCSSCDGVNFFNSEQKTNFKIASMDAGVHSLVIDPERQIAVVGTDKGQLMFFDYSNFARPTRFHEDPVSVVAALQPHAGAITAIILEKGTTGDWSRILTTSTDSSIFIMDFELNRDAKNLGTLCTNQLVRTPHGNFLIPVQSNIAGNPAGCAASLFAPESGIACSGDRKKTEGKAGSRVVSLRLCPEVNRIVVATDDGVIRFYTPSSAGPDLDDHAEEFLDATSTIMDMNPFTVRDFSTFAAPKYIAVALQRGAVSRSGFITILDVVGETQLIDAASVPLPVIDVQLHVHTKTEAAGATHPPTDTAASSKGASSIVYTFTVVAQLRNGEVYLLSGASDSRQLQLLKVLVREQVGSVLSPEASSLDMSTLHWPMPCKTMSSLNTKFEPARINLLFVDGMRTLRSVESSTGRDTTVATQFSAVYNFDIVQVVAVNQGSICYAVAVEHSTAFLTGPKGEALFEVHYDGAVADCSMLDTLNSKAYAKKHRSLLVEEAQQQSSALYYKEHPHCSSVAFCQELRFVAFGYRDGLIQLWDVSTHKVFKRIVAHAAPISAMWCFGEERKVMSVASNGQLRVDTVFSKTLKDSKNNSSATPATTPLPRSLSPSTNLLSPPSMTL